MNVMSAQATARRTERWILDPTRSTVGFRVPNFWGMSTVVGHFTRFDGSYAPDGQAVDLTVEVASLDTGNEKRDAHLRSGEFFDAAAHPRVRFTARDVTDAGNGTLQVQGELEAAGRIVPLAFDATVRELDGELEAEATAQVDQRLFDMTWSPLGMVRSPSTLHVKARLTPEGSR